MSALSIRFKINEFLDAHKITPNALAREAKVRPNLIYEMCNNETKRIELHNFDKIIQKLGEMTNTKIQIQDVIQYEEDAN